MTEQWAFCSVCARWFFVPEATADGAPHRGRCPVCLTLATRRTRDPDAAMEVRVRRSQR